MRLRLALIFFLSGASALIFEALWFRLAGLSLGNSVWSASLVLAAFMGGLALGNALVARAHHRISRPVRLYAILELVIGIGGIAVVLLLPQLPALLGPLLAALTDAPTVLNSVRLSIAFGILVVPAVAMGATLPVLVHALSRSDPNFGANVGWLYGWNTMGAVIGIVAAEFLFVPLVGILSSGFAALSCNLLAAFLALRISRSAESLAVAEHPQEVSTPPINAAVRRYLAVAFLSGALMLALEVVWFRFLLLTKDGTSLIFAVMLAVVLAGIAIGGLVGGSLFRRNEAAYCWLRHVSAASAVIVVLAYWGYDFFSAVREQQETSLFTFIGFALSLMFPASMLSGISFTMVNRAVKDTFRSAARATGNATFYNTVGAMFGSLLAGLVLLPMLGMEKSFFVIAAAYLAVSFVVPAEKQASPSVIAWNRGTVGLALVSLVAFPFGLMQERYFGIKPPQLPHHTLVAASEGLVETIRYYQRDVFGEAEYYRLVTNGHSMSATSTSAKRYMKLYVYLPIALNPDTQNALLISFGVGSTAKALTDTSGLEEIDIVDISRDVLDLSEIIYPGASNPLRDERVRVHVEDGRFFLNTTENYYDLITSEPPPPSLAGVVNLYSREYFELIRSRLSPGGYATYWLPVVQLAPAETLAITRAFCDAFSDCSLWAGSGLEWMLVGTNDSDGRTDVSRFSAQWRDPTVGSELVNLGIESPAQLGSLFMADASLLQVLTRDIAPVMDNYPARIAGSTEMQSGNVELYAALMDEHERLTRFRDSEFVARLWPEELRSQSEAYFQYERLIKNYFTYGAYRDQSDLYAWEAIDDVLENTSLTTLPLWLLGSERSTQVVVERQLAENGYDRKYALELARKFAAERNYETALMYAHDHVTSSESVPIGVSNLYLYLLAQTGKLDAARPHIEQLQSLGKPEADRFVNWYRERFDPAPVDASSGAAGPQPDSLATHAR